MTTANSKSLSAEQKNKLLETLQNRFEKNMKRHKGLVWKDIEAKIKKSSKKLWSLSEMERTGGEPDVVGFDKKTGEFIFTDCSDESPKGRRSCCYDEHSRTSRKEHAPEISAMGMAQAMGIKLLNEEEYRKLQKVEDFDQKTSTWIDTPESIRKLGGALFCDKRYENVFTYHNGAESYYASRGFRGSLRV
jgi:hypothetical protein